MRPKSLFVKEVTRFSKSILNPDSVHRGLKRIHRLAQLREQVCLGKAIAGLLHGRLEIRPVSEGAGITCRLNLVLLRDDSRESQVDVVRVSRDAFDREKRISTTRICAGGELRLIR